MLVGVVLRECGRKILFGLSFFLSTICFLVVRTSQIGSVSVELASSELSLASARRFWVVEDASLRFASDLMCLRSAFEAFSVYAVVRSIYTFSLWKLTWFLSS